jgi:hypothetical protein
MEVQDAVDLSVSGEPREEDRLSIVLLQEESLESDDEDGTPFCACCPLFFSGRF